MTATLERLARHRQTPGYKARVRAWRLANKDRDPEKRLAFNLRIRLYRAINRGSKAGSAVRDLGCSIAELKTYLEQQFAPGMSWGNYGDWHIDHVRPLALFDLTDRKQFLQAAHYTNLQPLWAADNLKKGKSWQE